MSANAIKGLRPLSSLFLSLILLSLGLIYYNLGHVSNYIRVIDGGMQWEPPLDEVRSVPNEPLNSNGIVSNGEELTAPKSTANERLRSSTLRYEKEILVVYSGPTSLNKNEGKNELYLHNFDFFLKHGIDCGFQDTVITATQEVYDAYQPKVNCSNLTWILREPECHDMETVHVVLFNSTINVRKYDYFVYINCGLTGPPPPSHRHRHWALSFITPLSDTVKMTGLSVNCFRKNSPHVQSMAYALDRVGLDLVMQSGSIFDCRNSSLIRPGDVQAKTFQRIVMLYERGMSKAILQAGYGLSAIIPNWSGTVFWENRTNCTMIDKWSNKLMRVSFGGRIPSLEEMIFFKTSRMLPKEYAELIQYPREPHWFAE